ncbi:MAG: HTH-type transcriptional regulator BetI [Acidimicrobiales bacterium]|nr:MAG: TetR/AcrR family transcriptional regulator [Actinomycetota bacterium]MBV6510359.1 HTH-type transcriptional regulator BetI [Acidimicrobiales bacterium]RIK03197.1 MAG: hypothetical protein DCC48_16930 [Acidobacteriota bacterium]
MRLPAAERRQQLLATALEVFAEKGFHDTSMNDVAAAAGVTKPVLYQHFPSKRELFRQLLHEIGEQLRQSIAEAWGSAEGGREELERGFEAYFEFLAKQHASYTVLFGAGTRRDAEFAAEVRAVEESIAEGIASRIMIEGITEEHRRFLAYAIVGMAEGSSRQVMLEHLDLDPRTLAARVSELAWAGLRGIRPTGH